MLINSLPPAILKRSKQLEMPVIYSEALTALRKCETLDVAKYYSEKSDALAAFAKMYGDEELSKSAARIKLHAYARMGQLASELRPRVSTGNGFKPGPKSLLIESGLSKSQSRAAMKLASLNKTEFDAVLIDPKTPITTVTVIHNASVSAGWKAFAYQSPGPVYFAAFCKRISARELARNLSVDEATNARKTLGEITEWLDAFELALPK